MLNPAKHRELNEAYLDMFVKMYGEQFDADDLKGASVETLEILNELYLAALGGKQEEKETAEGGEQQKGKQRQALRPDASKLSVAKAEQTERKERYGWEAERQHEQKPPETGPQAEGEQEKGVSESQCLASQKGKAEKGQGEEERSGNLAAECPRSADKELQIKEQFRDEKCDEKESRNALLL